MSVGATLREFALSPDFRQHYRKLIRGSDVPIEWSLQEGDRGLEALFLGVEAAVDKQEPAEGVIAAAQLRQWLGVPREQIIECARFHSQTLAGALTVNAIDGQAPSEHLLIALIASMLIYVAFGGELGLDS